MNFETEETWKMGVNSWEFGATAKNFAREL